MTVRFMILGRSQQPLEKPLEVSVHFYLENIMIATLKTIVHKRKHKINILL